MFYGWRPESRGGSLAKQKGEFAPTAAVPQGD